MRPGLFHAEEEDPGPLSVSLCEIIHMEISR
jgi:hypothetical protein